MPEHTYYSGGAWNVCCDVCGRVFKSSAIKDTWDGSKRCERCWETRHPQDLIKARPDNQSVPWSRGWIDSSADIVFWTNGDPPLLWTNGTKVVLWTN